MKHNLIFIPLMLLCAVVSQGWGANHILSLDGDGDYVRLPSNIFNKLDEATVEGWVRWEKLNTWVRFFDFGERWKSMNVYRQQDTNDLGFDLYDEKGVNHTIIAKGILSEGVWYHIAAVSGKGGMKLYVNGILMGENSYDGSFSRIGSGANNYLGLSNWGISQILHGQIDEVRVWGVARTERQIQDTMFRKLRGDEPDLIGYWQFEGEGEKASDSTKNEHHGEMFGDAKRVTMELPMNAEQMVSDTLTVKAWKQLDFKTGAKVEPAADWLKLAIIVERFPKVAGLVPLPVTIEIHDSTNRVLLKQTHTEGETLTWPVPDDFEGDVRIVARQTDSAGKERTGETIASTRKLDNGKPSIANFKQESFWQTYQYTDGLADNKVVRLLEAKDGTLWVGVHGVGFHITMGNPGRLSRGMMDWQVTQLYR